MALRTVWSSIISGWSLPLTPGAGAQPKVRKELKSTLRSTTDSGCGGADAQPPSTSSARRTRLRRTPTALMAGSLPGRDDVVHGVDHGLVGQVGAAALRGHVAGLALEAFDRVLVQRVRALRDARRPGRLVTELG